VLVAFAVRQGTLRVDKTVDSSEFIDALDVNYRSL
jgi:hypothetical protein